MPNFTISAMPPITLPIDPANTFFETQTVEGGLQVSRKVSATDLGIGGSVISVNSGLNITVDNTDPLNPIINLDAAIAPVDVNGVTLSNAGAATSYLDETGNYSVPAGGGGSPLTTVGDLYAFDGVDTRLPVGFDGTVLTANSAQPTGLEWVAILSPLPGGANTNIQFNNAGNFDGDAQFTYSTITGEFVITHDQAPGSGRPALLITNNIAAPGMRFNTNQSSYSLAEINSDSVANTGFDLDLDFTGADAQHFLRLTDQAGSFLQTWQRDGIVNISNNQLVVDPTGNAAIRIEASTLLEMGERAAANPLTAGIGQFWVRDDVPNVPMFTDDAGTDFVLNAAGSIPDPLILGSINLTSAGLVSTTGSPYTNVPINIGANLTGTMGMTQLARQNIQTKPSAFSFNSTLFININGAGTAGSDTIIGGLNSANIEIEFGTAVRMQHGLVSTVVFETNATGILLPVGGVISGEKAAQAAFIAGRGEFWVRNDVPCVPMFTNDVGTDFVLNASGAQTPWVSAIDADGFDLNDGGVIFLREQAAGEADVASQGQLWIRTDTFSNTLMFTNDNGNEFEVAGIPYNGDLLNGTGNLSDTTFAGWVNIGPKPNTHYMITITGSISAPAADDGKVDMTVDTNSIFVGMYTDSNGQHVPIESAIGEVITNTVVVDTDGTANPNGTYFQIIGHLITGATGQTVSLRAAKNADAGADGGIYFPAMAVQQLVEA